MLGAYMDDLGLQPEHLELALSRIQPSVRSAALQVYTNCFFKTHYIFKLNAPLIGES